VNCAVFVRAGFKCVEALGRIITSSIVQGSGIGPTLWLIMESDLHPLSDFQMLMSFSSTPMTPIC